MSEVNQDAPQATDTYLFHVAAAEEVVRWCETCGKSWILRDRRVGPEKKLVNYWKEIQEEE